MKRKLPQLKALPVHPNKIESEEKELFYPSWSCFCCRDTGIVDPHLARLVLPDFDWDRDKLPLCTNCNIQNEKTFLLDYGILDTRLHKEICAELDKISREDWAKTAKLQQQAAYKRKFEQAAISIATYKSLRKRDRTEYEELAKQQKHQWKRENWDLDLNTEELESEYSS